MSSKKIQINREEFLENYDTVCIDGMCDIPIVNANRFGEVIAGYGVQRTTVHIEDSNVTFR